MSILILDKTVCPICQKVIKAKDKYYSFPAFVINRNDPLYFFSDGSFHYSCLMTTELGEVAIAYAELFIQAVNPANRKSIVSGNMITDYENHIFIDYLTMNKNSMLNNFNFAHIDKSELLDWRERKNVITELTRLRNSGEWNETKGTAYLNRLIAKLFFAVP